jgi:hypothetical protein
MVNQGGIAMSGRFCIRFLLAAALLPLIPVRVHAGAIFWLGGGGAPCYFSSLAIALGAVPQGATIRIANNQPYANINLAISDLSVTLEGGWADCAGTPSGDRTVIEGAAGANLPVLRVEATGTARSVRLEHLQIRGGTRSGIEVDGPLDVRLDETLVNDNAAVDGGGISVIGASPAQTVLRLVHSTIGSPQPGVEPANTATGYGGGVHCEDARVQLSSALVQGNQAGFGGGLSLRGCSLDAAGPALDAPGFPLLSALVAGNVAAFFGGGLHAVQASEINLDTDDQPVTFHANSAGRGGGVYLADPGTHFNGAGITVSGNDASGFGGGIYIEDGAFLGLRRGADGDTCRHGATCSRIVDNEVAAAPTAGASAIQVSEASVVIDQTEVAGNVSHAAQAAFYVSGGGLRLIDSLVHDNDAGTGNLVVLYQTDNHLTLSASTVARNVSASPAIRVTQSEDTDTLHFDRGIFWQPGLDVHSAAGDLVTSVCMNAHPGAGIDDAVADDPAFVDADNGDFRLRADSPNIDACADVGTLGTGATYIDIGGASRPIALGNPALPFDRGAHELADLIFADGFDPIE